MINLTLRRPLGVQWRPFGASMNKFVSILCVEVKDVKEDFLYALVINIWLQLHLASITCTRGL